MKTRYIFMFVLATMAMVACEKENPNAGKLQLVAEGMGGNTKMAINGNSSYWVNGESVNINGSDYTITANSGSAYVDEDVSVTAPYLGVYPAGIINSISGHSYTLDLPAEYTYATTTFNSQTVQNLASPMVAYAEGGNQLYFKHVTAAIGVEITNDFGIDVKVTNITVTSQKYKLHGSTTVTLGNTISVTSESTDNAALRTVQMGFSETPLTIASGSSATVQVPVLPVGDDNCFSISVTVQNKDDAAMEYTFSKTQGSSQGHYALDRAQMGYAPAKFGAVYVVNASGDAVRFSPGNLQYIGSAATPYWKFATHQYDYIGASQGDGASNLDRDLFGWGASGYDNTSNDAFATNFAPYSTTEAPATYTSDPASAYQTNRYGYGPSTTMTDVSLTGTSVNYDWGWNNAIWNGGNVANRWRALSRDEFSYVLNTRDTDFKIGLTKTRYIYACLLGTYHGIILLPSDYVHPAGIATPVYGSSGWTSNAYSSDEWAQMETAGAVFLPAAGQRKGTTYSNAETYGNYWTTTYNSVTNANYYYFTSSNVKTTTTMRYFGYSVRLVRDVQ